MPPSQGPGLPTSARSAASMLVALCALAGGACHATVDSLGYEDAYGLGVLKQMSGPVTYTNFFRDVLGKSAADIKDKQSKAFDQLFHGDPNNEAIFVPVPGQTDQAYITDVLHDDIRTEGMGLGMIIAVELDKRDEFDQLWTYARAKLQQKDGPARGYFNSTCKSPGTADKEMPCLDPYGMEYMLMGLLLANDRWGTEEGGVDYSTGAKDLLTVMRHKQDENGGIVDGVTDTFDPQTHLVFDVPLASAAGVTRSSIVAPAFYDLWAEATGDPFWTRAATASRTFWKAAAHPKTGLMPSRSRFDGTPEAGSNTFRPEVYRAFVNFVLDRLWTPTDDWDVQEADKILQFFTDEGMDDYGRSYTLDGGLLDTPHDNSLVIVNGILAGISTVSARRAFMEEVWNRDIPILQARYYTGILQMLGLIILGGDCRVW